MTKHNQYLTNEQLDKIYNTILFQGMPNSFYETLLDRLDYVVEPHKKGDTVIVQNSKCMHLYVLVEGHLNVNIIDVAGNHVKVEELLASRAFATPHLFDEENLFPATFTALKDGLIFKATKESTFNLLSEEPELMKKFLRVTGNCKACTIGRLRILSFRSIRSRFIYYLFCRKKTDSYVLLGHNQTQLAEYIGASRPALATEIKNMTDEGLIELDKDIVTLLKPNELFKYI